MPIGLKLAGIGSLSLLLGTALALWSVYGGNVWAAHINGAWMGCF